MLNVEYMKPKRLENYFSHLTKFNVEPKLFFKLWKWNYCVNWSKKLWCKNLGHLNKYFAGNFTSNFLDPPCK